MLQMEKILDEAIEKEASDIHLIYGIKPMLRISRDLYSIDEMEELTEDDMWEMYDFFIRGNIENDELFWEIKTDKTFLSLHIQSYRIFETLQGRCQKIWKRNYV